MIKLLKKLFRKKYSICYEEVVYNTNFTKTNYFYY